MGATFVGDTSLPHRWADIPLVALIPSGDLLVCANDLFVAAWALSRSHRAAAVQLVVLLEQVIAWFIVDLEQPLQEEITLTRGTPAVLAALSLDSYPRG